MLFSLFLLSTDLGQLLIKVLLLFFELPFNMVNTEDKILELLVRNHLLFLPLSFNKLFKLLFKFIIDASFLISLCFTKFGETFLEVCLECLPSLVGILEHSGLLPVLVCDSLLGLRNNNLKFINMSFNGPCQS